MSRQACAAGAGAGGREGQAMRMEKQLLFWLAALALLVLAIALLENILLPFVSAVVFAYFLNPLVDGLERRGVPRALSVVAIVGVAALVVLLAIAVLVPLLVDQLRQLVQAVPGEAERLGGILEGRARHWLGPNFPAFQAALDRGRQEISAHWAGTAAAILATALSRGLALVNLAALLLITPVVVFYLLLDWHPMLTRIDAALPREHAPTVRQLARDIDDAVAAFIRGQGTVCLMLGIYYAVALSLAGVDYGLLVGVTTGVLAFIPVVGWLVGLVAASALTVAQYGVAFAPLAKVLGVLLGGLALDTAFLSPRFVGKKIGLHPVWLIFALFVFSYLFGFVGTLVAVPLAAAIAVLVRFAVKVYLASSIYRGREEAGEGLGARRAEDA
jgi:predicted PurR-regulated permease PerM